VAEPGRWFGWVIADEETQHAVLRLIDATFEAMSTPGSSG
jgi:hypothetical protein